jgi:hypothetical protein
MRFFIALALGVVSIGCAATGGSPAGRLPLELRPLWSEYASLPRPRALAIAGELRHNQWVAGASGGHTTHSEAEIGAMRECRKRRFERRIVAPCQIYAVDDEIVAAVR